MKNYKSLMIFALMIFTMACSKEQLPLDDNAASMVENKEFYEEQGTAAAVLDCGIDFQFLDKEGNNLLNHETQNHIEFEKIKVYYLVGDEKILVSDNKNEPCIGMKNENSFVLWLLTNTLEVYAANTTGTSTTYLEFEGGVTDTIVTDWYFYVSDTISEGADGGSYLGNVKAWYNGVEIKPHSVNTIIKDNN